MKKLFSLLFVALLATSAWAATDVTIDFSAQNYTNSQDFDGQTVTIDGISMTFSKGTGTTTPKYYTSGTSMRLYAGNTMIVAADNAITKIVFTYSQGAWPSDCVTEGAYADGVWAGNANSITFTNTGSAQVRIQKMVVTLAGDEPIVVVNPPTFNPEGQDFLTESLDVTLTAEEGATIYYNFDNGDTWNTYSAPITLTETTTVYAKAAKDGVESIVVHQTYNKIDPATNVTYLLVTDVADLADGDKVIIASSGVPGDAYAMGASRGNNFGGVAVTVENNMTISTYEANIITLEAYGNYWRLKANEGYLYAAANDKNYLKAEDTPDEDGNADATITIANDTTTIVFQGSNDQRNHMRFNASNNPVLFSCYAEDSSVKNPVYIYKATTEIPEPPVVEVVAPVLSPEHNTKFVGSQEVTITCETEGADIYYCINDGEYQLYEAPFTIEETATVKAYAMLGEAQSTTVSAKYIKLAEVENVAEANALDNKVDFIFNGSAVVTYQNGNNLWIRDDSGSGLIYGSQVPAMAQGTVINSGWIAQKYNFRGGLVPEFQYPTGVEASGNVVTVEPFERETLTNANVNEYVIMKNQTIIAETDTAVNNYQKYYYNADSLVMYNQFGVEFTLLEGKVYDVVGTVTVYNEKPQLYIISVTESAEPSYIRGDVDMDGNVGIADVTALIDYILTGNATGISVPAADCDQDEMIGIADVTALIDFILTGNWGE